MNKRDKLLSVALKVTVILLFTISIFQGNALSAPKGEVMDPQLRKFEIGGGAVGGIYYVCASAIADLFQKKLGMKIPFSASVTEGSGEDTGLIEKDRVEAATIASSAIYLSWERAKTL